jgi:hypothetical protein
VTVEKRPFDGRCPARSRLRAGAGFCGSAAWRGAIGRSDDRQCCRARAALALALAGEGGFDRCLPALAVFESARAYPARHAAILLPFDALLAAMAETGLMEEGHHFLTDILTTGAILLGAALVAVLVFRRLGLGAVLGYLVAGIVIGPDVLGLSGEPETILSFAEIGIILLLFLVGLELSPSRLWVMRRDILLFSDRCKWRCAGSPCSP